MRSPCKNLWLALAVSFAATVVPVCADTHDEGIFLYNSGMFAEAAACFEKSIAAQTSDVSSAYYLANCYAHLGEHLKAVRLYKLVVQADPAGEAGGWSRTALSRYQEIDRMRRQVAGYPPKHLNLHLQAAQSRIQQQAREHMYNLDWSANQHVGKVSHGAEVASHRIKSTADAEIAMLEAAKRSASSSSGRRGRVNVAGIDHDIALIKEWAAQNQMQTAMNAQYRIRKHQEHVAQRQAHLVESAQNLELLLADSGRTGVRLNPVGTNLYVRNYANSSAPVLP